MDAESAKQMQNNNKHVFGRHTLLKMAACGKFYNVTMGNREKMLAYVKLLEQGAHTIQSVGLNIAEKETVMGVLDRLLSHIGFLNGALEAWVNKDNLFALDHVRSRLLQEERRSKRRD